MCVRDGICEGLRGYQVQKVSSVRKLDVELVLSGCGCRAPDGDQMEIRCLSDVDLMFLCTLSEQVSLSLEAAPLKGLRISLVGLQKCMSSRKLHQTSTASSEEL